MRVTKTDLEFLVEAQKAFEKDTVLSTYRNGEDTHIALRTNGDKSRDSILIYRLDSLVAEFESVLEPARPLYESDFF